MGASEFEHHLESCPDCESRLAAEENLRTSLAGAQLYARAPENLRKRLQISLPTAAVPPPLKDSRSSIEKSWRWLAIAASVILAVLLGTQYMQKLNRYSQQQAMAEVIVDAHLRSLQPGHLEDVISTDQHTVKPWFNGKLDFSPQVQDFAADGFPLIGGRIDVVSDQPVAALVYRRNKHYINLFVWPSTTVSAPEVAASQRGYNVIHWMESGMNYWAISDVNRGALEDFVKLTRSGR